MSLPDQDHVENDGAERAPYAAPALIVLDAGQTASGPLDSTGESPFEVDTLS